MNRTREDIQQLKTQAGLKPYQSRLKDLASNGAEYCASCPWHESSGNHNPSLAVYKSKMDGSWLFKCMAGVKCEKHKGDAIAFVQQMDSLTFAEALRKIANDAGVAESADPAPSLGTPSAEQFSEARQYLAEHGVSAEVAKACGVNAVLHPKLGLALAMPYDSDPQVVKYRCVGEPKNKASKFLHDSGHPSDKLLYNVQRTEKELNASFCTEVYVVESERDCLMMNSLRHMAVSVSSATACLDADGKLKIDDESLAILARADEIFLALDQDLAGQKCADAFETDHAFTSNQIKRIQWPYGGKRSKDPKDIGDLYRADPEGFLDKLAELAHEARIRPPKWRQAFRTIAELDNSPVIQLIEGFMTEGNIGIGGLSGSGKTFVALSIAKALTTGKPFVGHFQVPVKHPVLYLIPEVGDRQFAMRARAFGLPVNDDSMFMCRILSQGATLPLDDPKVLDAIRNLKNPVVIIDTAIRFSKAKDEKSATDNLWMEQAIRGLREAGCIAVIALHHSLKENAKKKDFYPTLENTFRGTGDIGALLDIGYSVHPDRKADGQQITLRCVKPRDFDPPAPFNLGLRFVHNKTGQTHSYIYEKGDLVLLTPVTVDTDYNDDEEQDAMQMPVQDERLAARQSERGTLFVQQVIANPQISKNALRPLLKIRKEDISEFARTLGFDFIAGTWVDALVVRTPMQAG
jgi:AAA domain/CHC2 zinc finger